MDEVKVIGHIFGCIESQDRALRYTYDAIKKLQKYDKKFAFWSVLTTCAIVCLNHQTCENKHKIDILYRKIKKLEEENEKKNQEE